MSDHDNRATDDQLAKVLSEPIPITDASLDLFRLVAAELVRSRRLQRQDSRRAEQIKKLRWAIENTLGKVESLARADLELSDAQDRAESAEDAMDAAERRMGAAALELRNMRAWIAQVAELTSPGRASTVLDVGMLHELGTNVVKELEVLVTRLETP